MKIDRRRFIWSGSTLLAIPMLEALWPIRALAQAASAPRLAVLNFPLGVVQDSWKSGMSGNNIVLPTQLAGLEALKSELILPTGLTNLYAGQEPLGNGTHARSAGTFLTCAKPTIGETVQIAESIDRVIADKLGIATSPKAIAFGAPGDSGSDFGYSGVYGSNISWTGPSQPASRITNAREAFTKVFGSLMAPTSSTTAAADEARRASLRKSILDGAIGEINALKLKVSTSDNAKLDQYLTGLREVEQNVGAVPSAPPASSKPQCASPAIDGLDSSDYATFANAITDIMVLGMSCNLVQVASFIMDYEFNSHYVVDYHGISHYKSGNTQDKYQAVSRYYLSVYTRMIQKMKDTPDALGGTLLDRSIAVIGSGLHDADAHNSSNLPIVVAGRGGGMTPGKVITDQVPLANLWAAIAGRMGAPIGTFGDGTGVLAGV